MKKSTFFSVRNLTMLALLTALVVVLQYLGGFIHFGTFSVSLVLVPIVLGAALCGTAGGAWLGFVFGLVVLLGGDAATFLTIDPLATIFVVLAKGVLAGLCAGLVYRALSKKNKYLATTMAAVVCPLVNTGVFVLGCLTLFLPAMQAGAAEMGYNPLAYVILVMVGGNFIFELLVNLILSPVIVRLINIKIKT